MTEADVREALRDVVDPELGVNIVDLGLVYGIRVVGGDVHITMTMTSPACPLRDYLQDLVEAAVTSRISEANRVAIEIVDEPQHRVVDQPSAGPAGINGLRLSSERVTISAAGADYSAARRASTPHLLLTHACTPRYALCSPGISRFPICDRN